MPGRAGRWRGAAARRPPCWSPQLADPGRGWDAIVVGEYERAFYGSQYAMMAPLFEHYGVQLWMPEAGGRVDYASEHDEQAMTVLGLSSKREVTRTSIRVRTAMAVQAREQGRYLGGRPPYGYRLGDAGPHPNKAHAAWGRRAHRLEPDPETAHVVRWIFAQRLAGHSVARIARALNEAGVPCPSAADPGRNPHRAGTRVDAGHGHHDPGATRAIRAARCGTGSAPTRTSPIPADVSLGHKSVQRWNLPDGWVISRQPAHEALVSEADYIAAQDVSAARGPSPAGRLWRRRRSAGTCWPGCWSAGVRAADGIGVVQRQARLPVPPRPHHRQRARPGPAEERLRPRGPHPAAPARPAPAAHRARRRAAQAAHPPRNRRPAPGQLEDVIGYLREQQITLTYDPAAGTLHAGTGEAAQTITLKAS